MTRRNWVLPIAVVMALVLAMAANSALAAPPAGLQAGHNVALTCTNLLVNSDMETNNGWLFGASAAPGAYSTAQFVSPSHSVRLGITSGANVNTYSSMRQQVTIPVGAQARLNVQVYPISQPVDAGDRQEILIIDPINGTTLRQVWSYIGNNATWLPLQFDVSEFMGRTVDVYINVYNNGTGGLTAMFVDNVTLEICNNGGPTPTPTPIVVTATPTPIVVTATPTPIVVTATPTWIVVTATPTGPVVVTATPTWIVVTATPTPGPIVVTATPTSGPIVVTNTPTPIVVTATPTSGPIVVTATPTSGPIVVTATPTSGPIVVTATPTPGSPITVVPPSGCTNVIANGGFENWGSWTLGNTLLQPFYQGTIVHSGLRALAMGNTGQPNYISFSSASQRANLPKNPYRTAYLEFWRFTKSSGEAGDYQEFVVLNANTGQTLDVLWRQNLNENAWVMQQIDMTRYLGRDILVYFNVYNNGGSGTAAMYLDDVSLNLCAPSSSGSGSAGVNTVVPPIPPATATSESAVAVTVVPPSPSLATVIPPVVDLLATVSPSPDVWATIQASRSPTPQSGGDKETDGTSGGLASDLWTFIRQPANCFLLLLILVVIGLIIWVSSRLLVSLRENEGPSANATEAVGSTEPPAVVDAEEVVPPAPADNSMPNDEW